MSAAVDVGPAARGTALQRVRATLVLGVAVAARRLPGALVDATADVLGELWYRVAPGRAAVARGNLAHVVADLAGRGRGSATARAAAADPERLERLVRAAFRHLVRTYAEWCRGEAFAREAIARFHNADAAETAAAFAAGGPAVFATAHLGSMAAAAAVLAAGSRVPFTAPMEELADPALQRAMLRIRGSARGRIVGLSSARRELRAALRRGEIVGIVADRDIAGGGIEVPLFGLPAPLPVGPALLALETEAALHVATVNRAAGGRLVGRLTTLAEPPADLPRRARVEALLAAEAAALERLIAEAPEQWWAVFHPIWPAVGRRRRSAPAAAAPASPAASPAAGLPPAAAVPPAPPAGEARP